MADDNQTDLTKLTVELLSAYLANNVVPSADLPALIATTRASLADPGASGAQPAEEYVPAVTVRKSLASQDAIISMIDGKPYKTLKRHLATHGLTPEDYRARYNLPATYPLVAPTYSEKRRQVAASMGLGRSKTATPAAKKVEAPVESAPASSKATAKAPPKRKPKSSVTSVSAEVPISSKTKAPAAMKAAPAKAGEAVKAEVKAAAVKSKKAAPAKAAPAKAASAAASVPKAETAKKKPEAKTAGIASETKSPAAPRKKLKIAVGGNKAEVSTKPAKEKTPAAPKPTRAPKPSATSAESAPAKWDDKITV